MFWWGHVSMYSSLILHWQIKLRWWCLGFFTRPIIYSARSLKQDSTGRHFAPLGYIILAPPLPVVDNTPLYYFHSRRSKTYQSCSMGLYRLCIETTLPSTTHYASTLLIRPPILFCIKFDKDIDRIKFENPDKIFLKSPSAFFSHHKIIVFRERIIYFRPEFWS